MPTAHGDARGGAARRIVDDDAEQALAVIVRYRLSEGRRDHLAGVVPLPLVEGERRHARN
jgi:hypothetical protein